MHRKVLVMLFYAIIFTLKNLYLQTPIKLHKCSQNGYFDPCFICNYPNGPMNRPLHIYNPRCLVISQIHDVLFVYNRNLVNIKIVLWDTVRWYCEILSKLITLKIKLYVLFQHEIISHCFIPFVCTTCAVKRLSQNPLTLILLAFQLMPCTNNL